MEIGNAAIGCKRLLARRLIHQGREYSTVIVEISPDCRDISIIPFERETAATSYESKPLRTVRTADGRWLLEHIDPTVCDGN